MTPQTHSAVDPAVEAPHVPQAPTATDDPGAEDLVPSSRAPEPHTVEVVAGTLCSVEDGAVAVVELPGGLHGVIATEAFEKVPRIGTRLEFAFEPGHTDDKGRVKLELAAGDEKITWKNLDQGMLVDAMVTGMNVGGLELKIAGSKIRAFMPASQIDLSSQPDPTQYLNHKLHCKIISLERKRRRVVLSRRAVLEKEHRKQRLKEIKRGQELTGKVRKIEPFGAFIDLEPGLDGLVRIGDLAWHHVDDPAEVVQVGQEVKVKVLKVERGRLVLGLRQTQPNPWDAAAEKYAPGSKVKGRIVRTADFGAFMELEPGIEGMIHISQLSERRVESVDQAVREGQIVEAKVMEVDARKQRIGLSIRALTQPQIVGRSPEASRDEIRRYVKSADKAKAVESLMAKWGEGKGLKGGIG
jgi:small subunit ribosomal protein S1